MGFHEFETEMIALRKKIEQLDNVLNYVYNKDIQGVTRVMVSGEAGAVHWAILKTGDQILYTTNQEVCPYKWTLVRDSLPGNTVFRSDDLSICFAAYRSASDPLIADLLARLMNVERKEGTNKLYVIEKELGEEEKLFSVAEENFEYYNRLRAEEHFKHCNRLRTEASYMTEPPEEDNYDTQDWGQDGYYEYWEE